MSITSANAWQLATALGARRSGRGWTARCPAHADRTPSLSISEGVDGKVLVKCHAGCEQDAVIDALRRLGLWDDSRPTTPQRPRKPVDDRARVERAGAIWRETVPIFRTAGWDWLLARKIAIDDVPDHGGLRFHPRCPWGQGTTPCIVARFTDAITGAPLGIHRRPIGGGKPMSLGPIAGGVVRLWADEAVTTGLVIGEGVETVLAAATRIEHRRTLLQPAWACGSAGALKNFPVLAGIEALTILADNDASGRGQEDARSCGERWAQAGREVIVLMPDVIGFDFNDLVR
jgi:hypothetical protein